MLWKLKKGGYVRTTSTKNKKDDRGKLRKGLKGLSIDNWRESSIFLERLTDMFKVARLCPEFRKIELTNVLKPRRNGLVEDSNEYS